MTSQIQKIKNRAFGETKLQTSWNQLYLCSGLRLNQAQNLSNWFNNSQTVHRLTTHQRNQSKFVTSTRQKSRQISKIRKDSMITSSEIVGMVRSRQIIGRPIFPSVSNCSSYSAFYATIRVLTQDYSLELNCSARSGERPTLSVNPSPTLSTEVLQ